MRTHGKISTYNNGCRCKLCKEAARVARLRIRQKYRIDGPEMCIFCNQWFTKVVYHEPHYPERMKV